MILVSGVTGNIGGALARMLMKDGHALRGMSRDESKARAVVGEKNEVVAADFSKPESLADAFRSVKKAFFVGHAGPGLAGQGEAFFTAAKKAGAVHVVVVSSGTIDLNPPTTIGKWHLALEEKAKASGLAWTFLRGGNYSSNASRWAGMIKNAGVVFAPQNGKSAPIDPDDIARVAFHALTKPGHEGKIYGLTGSKLVTVEEQVASIAKAIGKPVRFQQIPRERAREGMLGSGMPAMFADALLELLEHPSIEHGILTNDVKTVTGKDARTFDEWLADHKSDFA